MRLLPLLIFLPLFAPSAFAVPFEVRGDKGAVLWKGETNSVLPSSVGRVSRETFEVNSIPFRGDDQTVSEIFGIGTRVESVSEDEMKVYGWCFTVNGQMPGATMDQVPVTNPNAEIVWFYAYALAYKGSWVGMCFVDED